MGLATPTLEQLIKERQPGRGRLAAAEAVQGASRVFALASGLPEAAKQVGNVGSLRRSRSGASGGGTAGWEKPAPSATPCIAGRASQ